MDILAGYSSPDIVYFVSSLNEKHVSFLLGLISTVAPRYNAPRYYADSDITRSVVDPDFLPPGENAKCACLNLLRIALTMTQETLGEQC